MSGLRAPQRVSTATQPFVAGPAAHTALQGPRSRGRGTTQEERAWGQADRVWGLRPRPAAGGVHTPGVLVPLSPRKKPQARPRPSGRLSVPPAMGDPNPECTGRTLSSPQIRRQSEAETDTERDTRREVRQGDTETETETQTQRDTQRDGDGRETETGHRAAPEEGQSSAQGQASWVGPLQAQGSLDHWGSSGPSLGQAESQHLVCGSPEDSMGGTARGLSVSAQTRARPAAPRAAGCRAGRAQASWGGSLLPLAGASGPPARRLPASPRGLQALGASNPSFSRRSRVRQRHPAGADPAPRRGGVPGCWHPRGPQTQAQACPWFRAPTPAPQPVRGSRELQG